MRDLIKLWEEPAAEELFMIAGWQQWADAGSTSSAFPRYLVNQTEARKIGEIDPQGFYLFQIPGTHHFLRPEIKLREGYRKTLTPKSNEFFYWGQGEKGLVVFLGHEPHLNVERYAEALFTAVKELGIKRVAVVGGVYGSVPFDKDREVVCAYSLQEMKPELEEYAVSFSNYEGGVSIGTYLVGKAEQVGIELFSFYPLVPSYDLSALSSTMQSMRLETDFKAWYDLLRRFNHMFGLQIDLADLEQKSQQLLRSVNAHIDGLDSRLPQLNVRQHMEQLASGFIERPFVPLDDVWERGLRDVLGDSEE